MKYKKGNMVKHPNVDWGNGIVLKDSDGITVKISFEKVGTKTISLQYIQPIQIDAATFTYIEKKRISEKSQIYSNEPFIDIFQDIKCKYPEHLIIIENGCYFEVFEQDAEYFSYLYDWKIYERQAGIPMTGFPEAAKKVWENLKRNKKPYVVVSQLPKSNHGKIERKISEIYL